MKKYLLTVLVLVGGLVPGQAWGKEFIDVSVADAHKVAIDVLSNEGVLQGYPDGFFRPDQLVNRAEAVKVLVGALGWDMAEGDVESAFRDVAADDWFKSYVMVARERGIVSGNPDGTFAPARTVVRAELAKMLLLGVGFDQQGWEGEQLFDDVPVGQWFTPYMNYAGKSGLFPKQNNNLLPDREMTRGEVAETLYMLGVIRRAQDKDFLLDQTNRQIAQIEPYLSAGNPANAHRAAELAINMMYQAVKSAPEDRYVLAKAQLTMAYGLLVEAYVLVLDINDNWSALKASKAVVLIDQAISKANEAGQIDAGLQGEIDYVLGRANDLKAQTSR